MSRAAHEFAPSQRAFVSDFVARPGGRFLYGRTEEARSIAACLEVDGFIDDFTTDDQFLGKPCLKLADAPEGARVVSTVVQARPHAALAKLRDRGLAHVDYFAFIALSGLPLREIPYWEGAKAHFEANEARYGAVRAALVDEASIDTFDRVLGFRLDHDLSRMAPFECRLDRMYFEDFLALPAEGAVFHDIGAWDGSNSRDFARHYPRMAQAALFEPLPTQAAGFRQAFADDPRFVVMEVALSDADAEAWFDVNGTASRIVDHDPGTRGVPVAVRTLDGLLARESGRLLPPHFIKMDIEGAEMHALRGARSTIARHAPAMAVSVYHHPAHLVEAFDLLRELRPDYRFRLRHYTEGYTETVLFATR
jgi:FkbM family methyltransferase